MPINQDQAQLIDLATSSYQNYVAGKHITTKGLLATSEVMPLMVDALAVLGPDFYFARLTCGKWGQRAEEILMSREKVSNVALMQSYHQDKSLLDYLGATYAGYQENGYLTMSDRGLRAVREWVPVLIRTLSGMGPEMHLMAAALQDMVATIPEISASELAGDDNSVHL